MNHTCDMTGEPIVVGDIIAFATFVGSRAALRIAKVLAHRANSLKIQSVHRRHSQKFELMRPGFITCASERAIVLERRTVGAAVLELLDTIVTDPPLVKAVAA